jgi:proteic killer suppression protein
MRRIKDSLTGDIFDGKCGKGIASGAARIAKMKIVRVLSARNLKDLVDPPSNHLEKLNGNREGQYSIRVNKKYRICFSWEDDKAFNIEFVDYHK